MLRAFIIVAGIIISSSACTRKDPNNNYTETTGDSLYDAWITLSDKGIQSEQQLKTELSNLQMVYPARALARRQKRRTFPGLFDERDLPLYDKYLEQLEKTGAEVHIQSKWLNGVSVLANRQQLEEIRNLSFVSEVSDIHLHDPDRTSFRNPQLSGFPPSPDFPADPSDLYESNHYGLADAQLQQLNLIALHEKGFTGKDVIIAVLDTGFELDHQAFNNSKHSIRVLKQWDLVNNDSLTIPEEGDPAEQHYHGSFVLGLIAACMPGQLIGSAYGANFILCKPEDANEEYLLEEKWFVAALEYAEFHGADIVSSSLTLYDHYAQEEMDGKTSVMAAGWNIATGNGIIGVTGGGNAGHDNDPALSHLGASADAFDLISVGSVDQYGQISSFSSDGPTTDGRIKPEVLARGTDAYTVSPIDKELYIPMSGTSMAAPLMAGAIACLLQAHPGWDTEELRTSLFSSGDYFRQHGKPDSLYIHGYGIPDISRAAGIQ